MRLRIRGRRPGGRPATGPTLHLPPEWVSQALCAQTDPEAFFPEKGGSTRAAKQVCAECAVRAECLAWALDRGEHYGIWGGTSEQERRALRRHHQHHDDQDDGAGEAAA